MCHKVGSFADVPACKKWFHQRRPVIQLCTVLPTCMNQDTNEMIGSSAKDQVKYAHIREEMPYLDRKVAKYFND